MRDRQEHSRAGKNLQTITCLVAWFAIGQSIELSCLSLEITETGPYSSGKRQAMYFAAPAVGSALGVEAPIPAFWPGSSQSRLEE